MKVSRASAQFLTVTYFYVAVPCMFRHFTDAPNGGLLLGKETANAYGLFRINWFHAILHIVLGIVGLFTLTDDNRARQYAQLNFGVCAGLVALSVFKPGGLKHFPLNRWVDMVNVLIAAIGFVVGFTKIGDKELSVE